MKTSMLARLARQRHQRANYMRLVAQTVEPCTPGVVSWPPVPGAVGYRVYGPAQPK